MKVFIDTSSLFKRYIDEDGSLELQDLFKTASQIIVSPVTWLEFNSILSRRSRDKSLTARQISFTISEAKRDFEFYLQIIWNKNLEQAATKLVHRCSLSTLDGIQLAAGVLSKADIFVTSDKRLFDEANKVIHKTRFI